MSMGLIIFVLAMMVATLVTIIISKGQMGKGSRWGLNLNLKHKCPNCDANLPAIRRPKNRRQYLWGGWTCEQCGMEFDKWLKPVPNDNDHE